MPTPVGKAQKSLEHLLSGGLGLQVRMLLHAPVTWLSEA